MNEYVVPGYIDTQIKNNEIYLTNSFTKAIIALEMKYQTELTALMNNGSDKVESELEHFMFDNGFLININEFSSIIENYFSDNESVLKIVLLPTEKCNFRCVYCYEEHNYSCEERFNSEAIIEFIKSRLIIDDRIKVVSVMWFGGEPLLKPSIIAQMNESIMNLCAAMRKSFMSGITTNGYLLDRNVFEKLNMLNVKHYQITIDGMNHDRFCVLPNGEGTYKTIIDNIKHISESSIDDFTVVIRVNVDQTSINNKEFYAGLKSVIGNDKRFRISAHSIFVEGEKAEGIAYTFDDSMLDLNKKQAIDSGLQYSDEADDNPINICYASSKNCFTFRPDGTIVKCTVALNSDFNQIGYIDDDMAVIDIAKNNEICTLAFEKCTLCTKITNCHHIKCLKTRMSDVECVRRERIKL